MKKLLIGLVLGMSLFVMPAATQAAGSLIPCGGSGPNDHPCQSCDVVTLANNVIAWLVGVLGAIAVLIIVYAGVKLVTAGGNQHAMEEAKSMMTNLIIGYVIVLGGWLVMDYVMSALVSGNWNTISCIDQPKVDQATEWSNPDKMLAGAQGWIAAPSTGSMISSCDVIPGPGVVGYDCSKQQATCSGNYGIPVVSATGNSVTCNPSHQAVPTGGSGGGAQCAVGNSACSISALQAKGMTSEQANIMSCIAMAESTGRPNAKSDSSTACGTFQVIKGTWAGAASGRCKDFSMCTDAECNIETVVTLLHQSKYSSWTCVAPDGTPCDAKAPGCIAKYTGS